MSGQIIYTITLPQYRHKWRHASKQANRNRHRHSPTDKQAGRRGKRTQARHPPEQAAAAKRAGDNERGSSSRLAARHDSRQARRGERNARHQRTAIGRGREQATERASRPRGIRSTKKKTGRGLFLIPVSHHYLMGIDFSEAPTTRSTCSFAAFLVLKP